MRSRTFSDTLVLITAGSVVSATPTHHKHNHHRHADRVEVRSPQEAKIVNLPGPTVITYELNGQVIDEVQVCEGLVDGSLDWAIGSEHPPSCALKDKAIKSATASDMAPTIVTSALILKNLPPTGIAVAADIIYEDAIKSKLVSIQYSELASQTPGKAISSSASSLSTIQSSHPEAVDASQGIDKDFPDGMIDCSVFPAEYGPLDISWANLGGWAGIQYIKTQGDVISQIDTAIPGGKGCVSGAMCSYACPPGYQKSQWPASQGSSGQSVGGLECDSDGKLKLTNPALSSKLCIRGTGATNVENKLSHNAAICRTDYPGTENEVVPLDTQPGRTSPLTCPDASTYFKHEGMPTTAQYYINDQGIDVQRACIWGTDGTNMGNWAPSYLGVGQDLGGKTWLAISTTTENFPRNYRALNYTVEIIGDISQPCRLKDGQYCSGKFYDLCNTQGCTVELLSGQATFVLSD